MNLLKIKDSNRKWYEIILWWEVRRIPYNLIMYFAGYLSFYIGFVTIPLAYLVIGLVLNSIYTLGWIIELLHFNRETVKSVRLKYPKYAFVIHLVLSVIFVFGFAVFLVI